MDSSTVEVQAALFEHGVSQINERRSTTDVKHNTHTAPAAQRQSLGADNTASVSDRLNPEDFCNLISMLKSRCGTHANQDLVFYARGRSESPVSISYSIFLDRIKDGAAQLLQEDIEPSSIILLHLDNHYDNLLYWWAVLYSGFVPAMSTPLSNDVDQRRVHLLHLWSTLDNPLVLTRQRLLADFSVQSALRVRVIEDLRPAAPDDCIKQGESKKATDLATLMLTSGSTGHCKVVCLTHGLVLKSIAGKAAMLQSNSATNFFSWVGADHVACLTEMHAHAFWAGGKQVYAEAADVISDPLSFWRICYKHKITHSFAPNFFLASLARALSSLDGIELRRSMNRTFLRTIVTGGEANAVDTCLTLTRILQDAGAPINCLRPAFGMTETSGGSIYSHVFPTHDIAQGYNFASVGKPIEGLETRIVDDDGHLLAPGQAGMLQVKGEVVFGGYHNDSEATENSFDDNWFNTGDQGMIDAGGQLVLTGRAKEILIINGVNHSPDSIETILEGVDGTVSNYTLALPYRAQEADTESLCVVYLPAYDPLSDAESREATDNAITAAVLLHVGVRPLVIPLDTHILQKSTLGKLPRNKIRKDLEAGLLESYGRDNQERILAYREAQYEEPASDTEQLIIDTFLEAVGVQGLRLGATTNLFAIGINSINLIAIKRKLETRLGRGKIPTATIIGSPTPRELAKELEVHQTTQRQYNPMVTLHAGGKLTPLWLIHPGVGEVLVFLALAYHIKDRPVYAMRARGFEADEPYFSSISDAVQTYYGKIRQVQPYGPYALAGYSFGSMVAFEVAKLLRQSDEVRFLGVFNLPPHIKMRMRQLDWYNCLLHLSYFLNFFSEEYAHKMLPMLQQGTRDAALQHVLEVAAPERLLQLGLDEAGLRNWADLAYSLQSSATDYEPSGNVHVMDVFYAIPLAEVAKDMNDWVDNHLSKWADFCQEQPRYHRVDGSHYTMISAAHVHTFQKVLKKALIDRNV